MTGVSGEMVPLTECEGEDEMAVDNRGNPSPPLGGPTGTLTCQRMTADGYCDASAVWHVSWYDEALPATEWENSLACQEHRDEAERRWSIGWRHRVLPACGLPGSRLKIAEEGDGEDGFPVTFCFHPFDAEQVATEAEQVTKAAAHARV